MPYRYTLCLAFLFLAVAPSATFADDVWVTSLASRTVAAEGNTKQIHYAATASGLLLQPAEVVQWEGEDFATRTKVMTHPSAVWCVQVSDDGSHVASADYRGNLQILDTASGQAAMHEGAFERWTQVIRFVPKSDAIVAGNEAGKLFVWEGDKVSKTIDVDKNALTDITFNSAGDRIAVSDGGGMVHLFSWPALEANGKIKFGDSPAWCVTFNGDSSAVIVGTGDRKLMRAEAKDAAVPELILDGSDWITRIAVSPTGAIAASEVGGKVYVLANDKPAPGTKPVGTAASGCWAVHWASPSTLLVGTRKSGVVSLGQTWSFVEPAPVVSPEAPAPAEPAPAPAEPAPAPAEPAPAPAEPAPAPAEPAPAQAEPKPAA